MPDLTINVKEQLGADADALLSHECKTVSKQAISLPGSDFIDRVVSLSDRNLATLRNFQTILDHGRLGGTGFVSILPVDQGIEHSAGASFAPNPDYFDPENIVKLALEGGCNAVAVDLRRVGHGGAQVCAQDPLPGEVQPQRAADVSEHVRPDPLRHDHAVLRDGRGSRSGRRSTSASEESGEQIRYVSEMFAHAHELGMVTVLWCYNAQQRLQGRRRRLPRVGRPDRPGQSPRRDDPGRHRQAEAADQQRRVQGAQHRRQLLRQVPQGDLHRAGWQR